MFSMAAVCGIWTTLRRRNSGDEDDSRNDEDDDDIDHGNDEVDTHGDDATVTYASTLMTTLWKA